MNKEKTGVFVYEGEGVKDCCHYEGCGNEAIERCSCKELFCRDHINDHDFCERIKRRMSSK